MRFTIHRTSHHHLLEKVPVEGAVRHDDGIQWTIEISSLEEFLTLSRKTNETLLVAAGDGDTLSDIEIYDDFRE